MNSVYEIVKVTKEMVIIKVTLEDDLAWCMHPYLDRYMQYITVTRGKNHTLSILSKNGNSCSFSWGHSGSTLICQSLKELKKSVISFIEDENHILLEWDDGKVDSVSVFFNPNFEKWQLQLKGKRGNNVLTANYLTDKCSSHKEMIEIADKFANFSVWKRTIGITGITVWESLF